MSDFPIRALDWFATVIAPWMLFVLVFVGLPVVVGLLVLVYLREFVRGER